MPNLCSALPVEILAWVFASTSGLMRKAIRAVAPREDATSLKRAKLGLGFDVEAENAGIQREGHLGAGLADAGKHDFPRRNARGQRPVDFALGNNVRAGAELGQRADDGKVGVRLDRIADQRVAGRERPGEDLIMPLDGRRRVAIERRAESCARLRQAPRPRHAGCRCDNRSNACRQRRCISSG